MGRGGCCAGTAQDQVTAEFVRDQFVAAGIPIVDVESFDVLLSYPQVGGRVGRWHGWMWREDRELVVWCCRVVGTRRRARSCRCRVVPSLIPTTTARSQRGCLRRVSVCQCVGEDVSSSVTEVGVCVCGAGGGAKRPIDTGPDPCVPESRILAIRGLHGPRGLRELRRGGRL